MSFAGKNLTQGGQMTAYRWRMFIQVNNWIGFWIFILFAVLTTAIFLWRIPQEALDNGSLWWFASINSSFIELMPATGTPKIYDVHYWYAPTATMMVLKMTLPQIYADPYMQAMGDQCLTELQWAACASGLFSMVVFIAVTWFIANIGRKESEDEYISGMQLTDKPAEVNKLLRKNGEFSDLRVGDLHMVRMAEVLNFLMHGTIGVGKSTLIRWLLDYIRKRGDRAIIYDSGCTFTETHYNPSTDFILCAHDERCANWQMWGECVDAVDYDNLAASLIPVEGDSDPFWVSSSRTIYADLAIRMSTDPERSIEKFLKTLLSLSMKNLRDYLANTPSANLVEEKIEKTAISIRSVVTNYAKALRYLQGLDDGTKPPFTIREWMTQERYDSSWLFISTQARHRKSVRPLISLWVSLATLMLQSMANRFAELSGGTENVTAVVIGRREQAQLTGLVREALQNAGQLGRDGVEIEARQPVWLDSKTRRMPGSYRPGMVLEDRTDAKERKSYVIDRVHEDTRVLSLIDGDGVLTRMKIGDISADWRLFSRETLSVATGEKLLSVAGDREHSLKAKDRLEVTGISEKGIEVKRGEDTLTLPKDQPLYLSHAYVTAPGGRDNDTGVVLAALNSRDISTQTMNSLAQSGHRAEVFTAEVQDRAEARLQRMKTNASPVQLVKNLSGHQDVSQAVDSLHDSVRTDAGLAVWRAINDQRTVVISELKLATEAQKYHPDLEAIGNEIGAMIKNGELLPATVHRGQVAIMSLRLRARKTGVRRWLPVGPSTSQLPASRSTSRFTPTIKRTGLRR
ncbi:TPA: type IV secretion system DNA-binding domain-containing protein [Enterobacter hormaechei]